jgi:glycosyltransferase involved in cell wall biosynthesis
LPDYAIRRRHLKPTMLLGWWARVLRALWRLTRLHHREHFDLIYSNTLAAGIGAPLRMLWRKPHVLHVHECQTSPRWLPKVLLWLARISTDRVICNSWYTARLVRAYQPDLWPRIVVVHNGIEFPEPVTVPQPDHGPLRIGCVARIHPKKGQDILLKALARATANGRDWEVHLFGDNLPEHEPLRASLEDFIARHHLEQRVIWHGFVEDPVTRYAHTDISVVPSVHPEEFSLVCVEAQAMERAVIATGPGGPSEILIDGVTGLIVPPRDPDALLTAISKLDDDPTTRQHMGHAGRQRVTEAFSRGRYAARVRSVLTAEADQTAEIDLAS